MAITQFYHISTAVYWTDGSGWSAGVPGSGDTALIGGDPFIVSDVGTIASLTLIVDAQFFASGTLPIHDGGALAVSGDVTDPYAINLTSQTKGAILQIGGTLIMNNGALGLDASGGPGNATVTAHALQESSGIISLVGGASASGQTSQAEVFINGAAGFSAPGVLDAYLSLSGNAVFGFASDQITTLTASAQLVLYGAKSFLGSGDLTSNSALLGLTSNSGYITLDDGAYVMTSGDLTNNGSLAVDYDGAAATHGLVRGGATLKIGGALKNTGAAASLNIGTDTLVASTLVEATALDNTKYLRIAGSAQYVAELRIDGAASLGTAGVFQGDVNLSGRALLDFTTGQFTLLASDSFLTLEGLHAFVANASDKTRNSALDGLNSIAGVLTLTGGASAALSGPLNVSGALDVEGGGSFKVGGALTNSSAILIGAGSDTAGSTLTAGNVSNTGTIALNSDDTFVTSNTAIGGGKSRAVVNALTGGGTVDLYAHATLEVGGAGDNKVVFSGVDALLKLDNPAAGYAGALSGFSQGDTLDLAHENASIVSYDGATLIVRTAAGVTQSFALSGPSANSLATRRDGAGGTDIVVGPPISRTVDDFNGDGKSDILWRNANGDAYLFNSATAGGFTGKDVGVVAASWQVAGIGDFNGDGKSDILWRNSNGDAYLYNSNTSGGFTGQDLGVTPTSWQIAGVGDFNGDGKSDILWRNANGDAYIFNSSPSGGFTGQDLGVTPTSWQIAGVGDFNDDGKADILWRNANGDAYIFNSNPSGGFTGEDLGVTPTSWQIAGVGDFNGDAKSDILWRNANGDAYIFNSNTSGGFAGQDLGVVPTSWQVAGVADFNGDGKSDIVWRNADGDAYLYNSNPSSGFTGHDLGVTPTSWQIQRG